MTKRTRLLRLRAGAAASLLLAAAACDGSPSEPDASLDITFVSGTAQSDTIGAVLPAPVVIEVRNTRQEPVSGVLVRFESANTNFPPGSTVPLSFVNPSGPLVSSLELRTDATGRAAVQVKLGEQLEDDLAGVIRVRMVAGGGIVADTFEVRPGQPATLTASGPGMAIAGDTITPVVRAWDRAGNELADVPYVATALTGNLLVTSSARSLYASGTGTGRFNVMAGVLSRLVEMLVVPQETLLGMRADAFASTLIMTGIDGEVIRTLGIGLYPDWNAAGDRFVFQRNQQLLVSDTLGNAQEVRAGLRVSGAAVWAATDEILFTEPQNPHVLWSVRPDGSDLRAVVIDSGATIRSFHPSPDGERIALTRRAGVSPEVIAIFDRGTGGVMPLTNGSAPRWSPTGEWILFTDPWNRVRSISPTGGFGPIIIEPTNIVIPRAIYDWTHDGRFAIVGHVAGGTTSRWIIVDHATRAEHRFVTDYTISSMASRP